MREGKEGKYYTLIVLDKVTKVEQHNVFDYTRACAGLGKILCLRKIDYYTQPLFSFLFTEVDEKDTQTLKCIVERDFDTYITPISHIIL